MPENDNDRQLEINEDGEGKIESLSDLATGLNLTNEQVAINTVQLTLFRGTTKAITVRWPWLKKETEE